MFRDNQVINYIQPKQVDYLCKLIQENQRIIITTHVHPDGDALGSELCLYYALKKLNKDVCIINHSPVPDKYNFLNTKGLIQVYDRLKHKSLLSQCQLCFVLDIGAWQRLNTVGEDLLRLRSQTVKRPYVVCIDHHPPEDPIGDYDIIYPDASSTGEILYLLLQKLNLPVTIDIAAAIYTAILTDTGSFRFSNTTPNSHYISGKLVEMGVNYQRIYHNVYENESPQKIQLLGKLLQNIHFECGDQVVWYAITQEMLQRFHLDPDETEGFADYPRRIKGVEISLLFIELNGSETKVSLRSTGRLPINGLAQEFGGGGHPYASGAVVQKPLKQTIEDVVGKVSRYTDHFLS